MLTGGRVKSEADAPRGQDHPDQAAKAGLVDLRRNAAYAHRFDWDQNVVGCYD
jgi:hypothetical protein